MLKVTSILLSAFCLLLPVLNAQIEKKELILTPEIEEMVVTQIKNLPEEEYSEFGITDRSQLMNLHLGKPVPKYILFNNEKLERIDTWSVARLSDGEPLSLRFTDAWFVPVMVDETPLSFGNIAFLDFARGKYLLSGTKNIIEPFRNYEHKDSLIGFVIVTPANLGMDDLLIIRKENQDIFVQIYDEATGEYFKNEYRFSELFNYIKGLNLRAKEARMRYYEKVANKSELILTPELTEMLINHAYSMHIDSPNESLSDYGIIERSQLEHLHLGKPIPRYGIVSEDYIFTFTGIWDVPVMSNGKPLFFTRVNLEEDGQYRWIGISGGNLAEVIHNYEHRDLIIGYLAGKSTGISGSSYLIIRKNNQDIFVKMYDYGEYLKNEYSLSEVINLLKIK